MTVACEEIVTWHPSGVSPAMPGEELDLCLGIFQKLMATVCFHLTPKSNEFAQIQPVAHEAAVAHYCRCRLFYVAASLWPLKQPQRLLFSAEREVVASCTSVWSAASCVGHVKRPAYQAYGRTPGPCWAQSSINPFHLLPAVIEKPQIQALGREAGLDSHIGHVHPHLPGSLLET